MGVATPRPGWCGRTSNHIKVGTTVIHRAGPIGPTVSGREAKTLQSAVAALVATTLRLLGFPNLLLLDEIHESYLNSIRRTPSERGGGGDHHRLGRQGLILRQQIKRGAGAPSRTEIHAVWPTKHVPTRTHSSRCQGCTGCSEKASTSDSSSNAGQVSSTPECLRKNEG